MALARVICGTFEAWLLAGIICGWIFGPIMASVAWLGDLFLDALKMMIIPLIVGAVISGVTSLGDIRKLGKVGGITLLYYASTTACAVLIGLIVVFILPGIPFILKLTPNKPSPISFGIIIFPITGIFDKSLFKFLAGTKVPLKLVNPVSSLYPSIKTDILGPTA